jgi:YesN/AraC family two-component response regulator
VRYASGLLISSDLSISEICFESGFGNISWFNRQFKKIRGISPKKYREKYTGEYLKSYVQHKESLQQVD